MCKCSSGYGYGEVGEISRDSRFVFVYVLCENPCCKVSRNWLVDGNVGLRSEVTTGVLMIRLERCEAIMGYTSVCCRRVMC